MPLPLEVRPEVAQALQAGRPVVALESTLIAHGLPWPVNLETARAAEETVRNQGAVPATLADKAWLAQANCPELAVDVIEQAGESA